MKKGVDEIDIFDKPNDCAPAANTTWHKPLNNPPLLAGRCSGGLGKDKSLFSSVFWL
jgi:hypothetical protein